MSYSLNDEILFNLLKWRVTNSTTRHNESDDFIMRSLLQIYP